MRVTTFLALGLTGCVLGLATDIVDCDHKSPDDVSQMSLAGLSDIGIPAANKKDGSVPHSGNPSDTVDRKRDASPDGGEDDLLDWACEHGMGERNCQDNDMGTAANLDGPVDRIADGAEDIIDDVVDSVDGVAHLHDTGSTSQKRDDDEDKIFVMGMPIPGAPIPNVPLDDFDTPGETITGIGAVRGVPITAVFALQNLDPAVVAQTWKIAGAKSFETTVTGPSVIDALVIPTPMAVVVTGDKVPAPDDKRAQATRLHTFTMTIVDEQPGERTLNMPTSSRSDCVTHTVTITRPTSAAEMVSPTVRVVEMQGTNVTLSPTFVSDGSTIYVTRSGDWAMETATVDLGRHGTRTITRYHSVSTSSDTSAETIKVVHLGSTEATLKPTTDSHGSSMYVTRTGAATEDPASTAASVHTVTYTLSTSSEVVATETVTGASSDVATTTRVYGGALPAVTKTIYRTIVCTSSKFNPHVNTTTIATVNGSPITITASSGAYGNHNQTVVIVAPTPEATLYPLRYDPDVLDALLRFTLDKYQLGKTCGHVLSQNADALRELYPDLDWSEVTQTADLLRTHYGDLDWDRSVRHAVCWNLEQCQDSPHAKRGLTGKSKSKGKSPTTVSATANITMTRALIGGTLVDITQPLQTVDSTMVVTVDSHTPFDLGWAARQTPVATPPACLKGKGHHYNKTECKIQKCMLNHHKPINITTVFPAVMAQRACPFAQTIDHFTHVTSIAGAHWGTTKGGRTYYPLKTTVMPAKNGSPTVTVVRETPRALEHHWNVEDAPDCWDLGTCCRKCTQDALHPHDFLSGHPWLYWLAGVGALLLPLLACLTCCTWCCLRHRRNKKLDPHASVIDIVPGIQRKKTNVIATVDPNTQVIETVTTSTTDPGLATAAGAAAGATLMSEKLGRPAGSTATTTGADTAGGDGRGTLSRRAEEGRGRVQFAQDPVQPVNPTMTTAAPQERVGQNAIPIVTTSEHVDKPTPVGDDPAKPVQRTFTTPAGQPVTVVDKAASATDKTASAGGDPAKPIERTFTTPAGQAVTVVEKEAEPPHADGAADARRTGSEVAGMGSMRGRKKTNKSDGARDLRNIGF